MADLATQPTAAPTASIPTRRRAAPRIDRLGLWRAVTSPFWVWSDLPAPDLPTRESKPAEPLGPAGEVFLAGLDAIRRRLWVRHALLILVRAVWLGLAGACLWVAVGLPLGGPALDLRVLGRVLLGLLTLGALVALLAKPGRARTARMLDRTFDLQERVTTAVEDLGRGVPGPGERAPIVYLQMADGANVMDELRRHPALGWRVPTREIVLAVFWALLLAALAFLRGVGGGVPPLGAAAVPPFTPAVERPEEPAPVAPATLDEGEVPSVQEVLERSARSAQARQDLETLAAALADHAVTSDAAEAIRDGAYERAADGLRELAPGAGDLSEGSRGELAGDLDAAAERMAPDGEGLQQASEQAAAGLRQGEQPATEGLRSLAEAVERTGEQIAPQGELAEQMQRAQQAAARGQQGRSESGAPGQQGQPGEGQPQQGGPPQSGDDPGSGADAAGQAGEASQAGQASQGGPGEPGRSEQEGAPGDAGQPGESGQSGQGEQSGRGGEGATQGQASGETETSASQGAGAGAGEGNEQEGDQPGAPEGADEEAGEDGPATERVSDGDGGRGEADAPAEVTEAIALPPGDGNQGVQTSGDGGSSLLGSGAGVTAGSGDAVQGEVGEAGPDSNHVPPVHRGLVERYFGDPFAAPEPESGP